MHTFYWAVMTPPTVGGHKAMLRFIQRSVCPISYSFLFTRWRNAHIAVSYTFDRWQHGKPGPHPNAISWRREGGISSPHNMLLIQGMYQPVPSTQLVYNKTHNQHYEYTEQDYWIYTLKIHFSCAWCMVLVQDRPCKEYRYGTCIPFPSKSIKNVIHWVIFPHMATALQAFFSADALLFWLVTVEHSTEKKSCCIFLEGFPFVRTWPVTEQLEKWKQKPKNKQDMYQQCVATKNDQSFAYSLNQLNQATVSYRREEVSVVCVAEQWMCLDKCQL